MFILRFASLMATALFLLLPVDGKGQLLQQLNPQTLLSNAGQTGLGGEFRIEAGFHQFSGFGDGQPAEQILEADLQFDRVGVGAIARRRVQGALEQVDARLQYAYHIKGQQWVLSMGLYAGMVSRALDWESLHFQTSAAQDPAFDARTTQTRLDFGAGLTWKGDRWRFYTGVQHLTTPDFSDPQQPETINNRLPRRWLIGVETTWELPGTDIKLCPSLFFVDPAFLAGATRSSLQLNADDQPPFLGLGLSLLPIPALELGAALQWSPESGQADAPLVLQQWAIIGQFKWKDRYKLGVGYGFPVQASTLFSHTLEVRIGYRLPEGKEKETSLEEILH